MPEHTEEEYMTVGELAERVGVTVRTIQYYDQENLLKPSAKGSRNQRLYTKKDQDKLYKILCFKFMGLSLTEIRQSLNGFDAHRGSQAFAGQKNQRCRKRSFCIDETVRYIKKSQRNSKIRPGRQLATLCPCHRAFSGRRKIYLETELLL